MSVSEERNFSGAFHGRRITRSAPHQPTRADGSVTRVAGVLTDDHSKAAIGLPCEVLYEPTADPRIVMPRWKITASSAKGWSFDDHEAGKY
jgi:hypothetical protein